MKNISHLLSWPREWGCLKSLTERRYLCRSCHCSDNNNTTTTSDNSSVYCYVILKQEPEVVEGGHVED